MNQKSGKYRRKSQGVTGISKKKGEVSAKGRGRKPQTSDKNKQD